MDRRLDPESARIVGASVAGIVALVVGIGTRPWLDNLEGPFGEHGGLGALASLSVAVLAGGALHLPTAALARHSVVGLVAWSALLMCATIVLLPTRIDVSESFVPQPNERSSCSGLTFTHYPPGTMDASNVTCCVGFEHPLPDG